ncbi:MAG: TonB-dependent receptor [Cellvibrionaceae bacterium]
MKFTNFWIAAVLGPLFVCPPLSVQAAQSDQLDEMVITSSRIPLPARQLGTSVSRLDEGDIAARGFVALADVLRTLPAVGVSNSGGLGKPTALRIRGEESFRTLVLIDGMDVSDPTPPQVSPQIQHIGSAGIGAVEILRGPQGMMYGADAGGVVNIQTIQPDDGLHTGVRLDAGRYDTKQVFADLGAQAGAADFYLSGNSVETGGFNARSDDITLADKDGYENTTMHSRLGWQASDRLRLQAVVRDVSSNNEYDGCFAGATTHDCSNDFDQRSVRLSLDYLGAATTQRLAVQRSKLESEDYAAGVPSFASEGELGKIEYLGSAALTENTSLVFGVDHQEEQIESGNEDLSRDQLGYYAEYQGRYFDNLYMTAGLRRDDNDDFGRHTSYRWSAAYLLPVGREDAVKLKASAGNGFRAPSLYEVAYNSGPWASPPAVDVVLREEQSRGFDLGVEYYISNHTHLEVVYFEQTIEDEIFFDSVTFSGYLQSRGDNESTGVELVGRYQPAASWALWGNFTYNDTETGAGDPRVRRPKQLANAGLSLYPRQAIAAHLNWRSSRNARANDGSKLDDYTVVDASASYSLAASVLLRLRVENVFDQDYQEILGFNTSGRAAYAGVEFRF